MSISLRDRVENEEMRRKTRMADAVERIARSKWRWATLVAKVDIKWKAIK